MGKYMERCKVLRADKTRHYGCSQAVFIPVAEDYGMDLETAFNVSAHFRAGMLTASTCGAVTGALMALGIAGKSNKDAVEFQKRIAANHENTIQCKDLLDKWTAAGNKDRKPHCDGMCFECVALLEEMLLGEKSE